MSVSIDSESSFSLIDKPSESQSTISDGANSPSSPITEDNPDDKPTLSRIRKDYVDGDWVESEDVAKPSSEESEVEPTYAFAIVRSFYPPNPRPSSVEIQIRSQFLKNVGKEVMYTLRNISWTTKTVNVRSRLSPYASYHSRYLRVLTLRFYSAV